MWGAPATKRTEQGRTRSVSLHSPSSTRAWIPPASLPLLLPSAHLLVPPLLPAAPPPAAIATTRPAAPSATAAM